MGAGASSAPKGAAAKYAASVTEVTAVSVTPASTKIELDSDAYAAALASAVTPNWTAGEATCCSASTSKNGRALGQRGGVSAQGSYRNREVKKNAAFCEQWNADASETSLQSAPGQSSVFVATANPMERQTSGGSLGRMAPRSASGTLLSNRGPNFVMASESPFCNTWPEKAAPSFALDASGHALAGTWSSPSKLDLPPAVACVVGSMRARDALQSLSQSTPPGFRALPTIAPSEVLINLPEEPANRSVVGKMAASYWRNEDRSVDFARRPSHEEITPITDPIPGPENDHFQKEDPWQKYKDEQDACCKQAPCKMYNDEQEQPGCTCLHAFPQGDFKVKKTCGLGCINASTEFQPAGANTACAA